MVRLPTLDDGEVAGDRRFEDVLATVEFTHFLAFGNRGAITGGSEEGRNAGAAGAHLLGEGALGRQFDFQLAAQQLLLEQGVFANVGGDHLADLAVFEQHAEAETIDAAVVGDHGEALGATAADLGDQVLGDATDAETTGQDGHVVSQPVQGFLVAVYPLVESTHAHVPLVFIDRGGVPPVSGPELLPSRLIC
ncbi:hypothetical protein FQZ97_754390 [compost metagenome]